MGAKKLLVAVLLQLLLPPPAQLNSQDAPAVEAPAAPRRSGPGPGGSSEYGVKLCGREFIRAVIFTCGGSRWKRVSPQQGMEESALPGRARADFVQTNHDKEVENIKLQSVLDPELEQQQSVSQPTGQQSLKYLLNLYDDYNEYVPASDNFSKYIRQVEDAAHKSNSGTGLANAVGADNFSWVRYSRRKRDMSIGVAGMCCKWGCTKTEISTLC